MKKGHTNNPNGRPVGSKDKATQALRNRVELLIDNNWDKLQRDIDKLEPKERVDAILRLLEFSIPKMQRIGIESAIAQRRSEEDIIPNLTDEECEVLLKIGLNKLDEEGAY